QSPPDHADPAAPRASARPPAPARPPPRAVDRGRPPSRRRDSAEKAPPAPGSWSRNSGRRLSRPRRCRRSRRRWVQARSTPRSRSRAAGVSRPGRRCARAVSGAGAGPVGPGLRGSRAEADGGWRARVSGLARARGRAWAGDSGDARPGAAGSGSGSGLGARGRPGLACGRPRSAARPGTRGFCGERIVLWGVALIERHCPSLKPCLWGFLHRLQLSAGVLGCQGVLVLGVRGDPWCGREEPLQHLLGCGRGGCVWGGTEKRNVTEILFGYSAEVVTFLFSTPVHTLVLACMWTLTQTTPLDATEPSTIKSISLSNSHVSQNRESQYKGNLEESSWFLGS
ncbi:hypothetical protein LEMLEM_LOCUS24093, partial [Lemmus lemmus]